MIFSFWSSPRVLKGTVWVPISQSWSPLVTSSYGPLGVARSPAVLSVSLPVYSEYVASEDIMWLCSGFFPKLSLGTLGVEGGLWPMLVRGWYAELVSSKRKVWGPLRVPPLALCVWIDVSSECNTERSICVAYSLVRVLSLGGLPAFCVGLSDKSFISCPICASKKSSFSSRFCNGAW
jgi:hypothetical protein